MHISALSQRISDSKTLQLNDKAGRLKEEGQPVIHLGGGEPQSPMPGAALEASLKKINSGKVKYTPVGGTKAMKKAVLAYTERQYGRLFKPENVLVSSGAKQALYNFLLAAVDPGDEVVFPAPYWVSYPDMVRLAGGTPVIVRPQDGRFEPRFEELKAAVTPKTRAIILNSPNNPSGEVYSEQLVAETARFCEKQGIYLVMDDIYHQLVFDGLKSPACYGFTKTDPFIVVINGISKLYGMTGFRIGWSVANPELTAAMNRLQGQTTSCPSDLSQAAAAAALEGPQDCVKELCKTLEDSRNALAAELKKCSRIKLRLPKGTFYSLPDFSDCGMSSNELCAFLLEKALVVTVPGSEFGMEGYLRLSYCGPKADVVEGAKRICWALDSSAPKTIKLGDKEVTRTWL
ncbi:MAG TPA: pyridoxal phosphate-dependent aminotransferase [Elusimicrobiales bacterium]|nr:pyridoxal phosphate-dependent aminotransferase [Elusimicrobiales bacterium]